MAACCNDVVRCITAWCIAVYCNAMYGAVAWRGTAGALGFVRCSVDGVGSARQAFYEASAFNQNIGSWNTASMTTMATVSALLQLHASGRQPKTFPQQWSRPQVVSGAAVGMAHLGCARVPAQMWESPRRCG
jgi:surface protein